MNTLEIVIIVATIILGGMTYFRTGSVLLHCLITAIGFGVLFVMSDPINPWWLCGLLCALFIAIRKVTMSKRG